ncbi:MAG: hypothetical protein JST00_19125 [Deltaproteobacteria bacterium]|nr:hypothetical protein [Deltaproteobacteria bacterium]
MRHVVRVLCFAILLGLVACVKRDVARETQPLHADLRDYWTCAVAFASDGRGDNANEAFTFVPWLETRIREKGVFEPLERRDAKEAEITVRVDVTGDDEQVLVRLLLLDTKSKAELGEFESGGGPPPVAAPTKAPASEDVPVVTETKRTLAMRAAADRILEVLKEKRRLASLEPRKPAAPPPPAELPSTTGAGGAVCSTQCLSPAASHATHDDLYRVSAGIDPTMRALRECLDRVGGQLVNPAVLLRFGPDGRLRHVRVDVGGYEELECIQAVRARAIRTSTGRAAILRCEHKCTTS